MNLHNKLRSNAFFLRSKLNYFGSQDLEYAKKTGSTPTISIVQECRQLIELLVAALGQLNKQQ